MDGPGRPVTGYPAPNPNAYTGNPPPSGTAPYAYPTAYYQPDPIGGRRQVWLRRVLAVAIGLIIALGAAIFIAWLVLRPQVPEFRVDSFSLTNFTVDNASVISFSSEVRLTARNPNKKMSLDYDRIDAMIFYKSWSISDTVIPPFSQGTKNETSMTAKFAAVGRFLDESAVDGINRERRGNGNVGFNLRVLARVKFKATAWRTRKRYLKVFCGDLVVGIPTNGRPGMLTGGSRECHEGI